MERQLTTEQKREYLRLLLADGSEAARAYGNTLHPRRMVFYTRDDLKAYEKETGQPVTGWAIILPSQRKP